MIRKIQMLHVALCCGEREREIYIYIHIYHIYIYYVVYMYTIQGQVKGGHGIQYGKVGHGILYGDHIMVPSKVLIHDPCPLGLPEIFHRTHKASAVTLGASQIKAAIDGSLAPSGMGCLQSKFPCIPRPSNFP